jgi:hypothetical protein
MTYVAIDAGDEYSMARRSDGSVIVWGRCIYDLCPAPDLPATFSLSEVTAGTFSAAMRIESSCPPPIVYCTAKVNTLGCIPMISVVGLPSASAGSGCNLFTKNAIAMRNGIFFHGTSSAWTLPFHGGYLCVADPSRRHGLLNSGGTPGTCQGVYAEDFNAYIASGADPALVSGATVWIQCWYRDPADTFGDGLSDAVSLVICP